MSTRVRCWSKCEKLPKCPIEINKLSLLITAHIGILLIYGHSNDFFIVSNLSRIAYLPSSLAFSLMLSTKNLISCLSLSLMSGGSGSLLDVRLCDVSSL